MSRSVVSKRFVQKLFPHDMEIQMHASHDCFHDTLCSRGNSDSRNTYPTGLHCLRVHADVSFQDICPFARQIAHQVFRLFDHALKKSGTPLLAKFVRREQVRVFDDPVFQPEEHPDV